MINSTHTTRVTSEQSGSSRFIVHLKKDRCKAITIYVVANNHTDFTYPSINKNTAGGHTPLLVPVVRLLSGYTNTL
jgi:hypothetical protein